jgi:nicotinate-nucleotide adenylyltransferase
MRQGIFSGTFDPVHNGHLALAEAAICKLQLNTVLFLPEKNPRAKQTALPYEHRYNMLAAALERHEKCFVVETPTDRFTIATTLPYLQDTLQQQHFYFIVGADVFMHFLKRPWPDSKALISAVHFAAGYRNPHEISEIKKAIHAFERTENITLEYSFIEDTLPNISSSNIRKLTRSAMKPLVPKRTLEYIQEHQLYTTTP